MNDLLLTIASLAVGSIISIIITRAYYRRGGFSYYVKDLELFDVKSFRKDDRIVVTADGKSVDELRQAIIAFWNSGSVGHSRDAIAPSDTLRLTFPSAGFRQVLGTMQSRRAVGAEFTEGTENIGVSFDLLDEGDWVVAYVLYERAGDSAQLQRPEMTGSLMNLPKGFRFVDLEDHFTERMWNRRVAALGMALIPIIMGYTFYQMITGLREIEKLSGQPFPGLSIASWVGAVVVTALTIIAILYLTSHWMVASAKVPKGLLRALPMKKTGWFNK